MLCWLFLCLQVSIFIKKLLCWLFLYLQVSIFIRQLLCWLFITSSGKGLYDSIVTIKYTFLKSYPYTSAVCTYVEACTAMSAGTLVYIYWTAWAVYTLFRTDIDTRSALYAFVRNCKSSAYTHGLINDIRDNFCGNAIRCFVIRIRRFCRYSISICKSKHIPTYPYIVSGRMKSWIFYYMQI